MKTVAVMLPIEAIQRGDTTEILNICQSFTKGHSTAQQNAAKKKFCKYLESEDKVYTWERKEILNVVCTSAKLFSGKAICEKLRETKVISKRTVYNTLQLLLQAGVIKKVNEQEVLFNQSLMELVV